MSVHTAALATSRDDPNGVSGFSELSPRLHQIFSRAGKILRSWCFFYALAMLSWDEVSDCPRQGERDLPASGKSAENLKGKVADAT